jgi:hypothetical protein
MSWKVFAIVPNKPNCRPSLEVPTDKKFTAEQKRKKVWRLVNLSENFQNRPNIGMQWRQSYGRIGRIKTRELLLQGGQ